MTSDLFLGEDPPFESGQYVLGCTLDDISLESMANPRADYQMRVLIIENSLVLRRLIETCLRDFDLDFEAQRLPHTEQHMGGFEDAGLVIIGVYQPLASYNRMLWMNGFG